MVPQQGYEPSPSSPPYRITVDTSTFSSRDNIIVSLQVASSNPTFFRGFLIEARDAGKLASAAVGFFILTDPHESQLLQCDHTQHAGCTLMALSVIQLIMAFLRPALESPRRIIFSWMHFGTGTVCQLLAVVSLFLGAAQQELLLSSPWSAEVLTGWLLWIVLANLLLVIHSYRLRGRGNIHSDDKENILSAQLERQEHEEISEVKKMVLVVFLLGNTALLAAFIKAIESV